MSPRSSERQSGLSLLELAVSLAVAGLLLAGITRFFRDSHRAYNLQEELSTRDQNAHYAIKRLSEKIMEAGSNLPGNKWNIIKTPGAPWKTFTMSVNPRGGVQPIGTDLADVWQVPVDEGRGFKDADHVLLVDKDESLAPILIAIDRSYGQSGFVEGVKEVAGDPDTVRLGASHSFEIGDVIYAYAEETYLLEDGNLKVGDNVLAEEIDSLKVVFHDRGGSPATDWEKMQSARVEVTARTSRSEPNLEGDGYRRISLSIETRLRNKL